MPIIRKIAPPERDEPEGPPPGFPPLTLDHLRSWLGEATLRRGEPYVEDRIFETRRTQRTLKARCQGSASQPYQVEATIGALNGVYSYEGEPVVLLVFEASSFTGEPRPGDDLDQLGWFSAADLPPLAFEHDRAIIASHLERSMDDSEE